MNIIISNTSTTPIYMQIKEQIKSAIFTGSIKEGDMLPSIRQLAKDLQISVITTTRAYNDLEQEGFIVNRQGKGCYVRPQNPGLLQEQKLRAVENCLSEAIRQARLCGLGSGELTGMLQNLLEEEEHA